MKSKLISLIAILALGTFSLASSACMSHGAYNQKWEYKIIGPQTRADGGQKGPKDEPALVKAGKDGWILVSVAAIQSDGNTYYTLYLKRPITKK